MKTKDLKLTKRQSQYADEHIGVVFSFLKEHGLDIGDFYDEVIFRYMRAVKNYLTRKDLRKYAFTTIAWSAMNSAMDTYRKRMSRRPQTVSLNSIISGTDDLCFLDAMEQTIDVIEILENRQMIQDILMLLTKWERNVLRLLVEGYSSDEIADRYGTAPAKVEATMICVQSKAASRFPEIAAEYVFANVA